MTTKVGEYKGFEIYFDSSSETFSVEGYEQSTERRKSYNACKTYINKYIKENQTFGEFRIVKLPSGRGEKGLEYATVKGIHGNGNFLCERDNGDRFQISTSYKYDMKVWCLPEDLHNSDYDPIKVKNLNDQIQSLKNQITEEMRKLPENCQELFLKVKKEHENFWT